MSIEFEKWWDEWKYEELPDNDYIASITWNAAMKHAEKIFTPVNIGNITLPSRAMVCSKVAISTDRTWIDSQSYYRGVHNTYNYFLNLKNINKKLKSK